MRKRSHGVAFYESEWAEIDREVKRLQETAPRQSWNRASVVRDLALRELQAVQKRTARAKSGSQAA